MGNNDLISIVVPVYKVEQYLPKCIDSILAQTYTNFELILVDDGSPDNSGKICDDYAEKDSRVRVIHKENGGLSSARNAGILKATGKYIGFIDGDDYIASNMFECLYQAIQENHAQLSVCDFQNVNDEGECLQTTTKHMTEDNTISGRELLSSDALSVFWVIACNKLFEKTLFDKTRFYEGKQHEDEFFIHKILKQCETIAVVRKKLYYYVQRKNSITGSTINKAKFHAVEALLNRAEDFLTYCIYGKALYKTAISAVLILCETYQALKKTNPEVRETYRRYRVRCRAVIAKLMKTNPGVWGMVLIFLYIMPCFGSRIVWFMLNRRT